MDSQRPPAAGAGLAGYRLEALIGRGGMGEVYRAFDDRLERLVALKVLAGELADDPAFRDRLQRESRLAAALDHPNVVPVYESGEADDGRLFIAMRYVEGTDLRSLLRRCRSLPPERALALVAPIADALDSAHERGLVHRDVKPSNVLIDDPGGRDHPYLADFGLTQSAGDAGPADGGLMGTIDYVAPEQIRGETLDGRADQYALACMLFECITGALPFAERSDVATIFAHLETPAPAASALAPGLPERLDGVLRRGLSKDREERYPDCRSFVAAARTALQLDVEPKRSRRPLALAAGLAAALAAALAAVLLLGGDEPAAAGSAGAAVRIDPRSGNVVASYDIGGTPASIAAGGGSVWIGSYEDGTLWRVRPSAGTVHKVTAVGSPRDLTYHAGRVYVAGDGPDQLEGNVTGYDATTGAREDGVELRACSIAAGQAEGLWATGCPNVEQLREGATGLRIVNKLSLPYPARLTAGNLRSCQCDMSAGDGAIWVAGDPADPRVWKIDARSHRITRTVRLPFAIGRGLAAADRALWVTGLLDDLVARVDARTGRITDRIAVGRGPVGLALAGDRLWVADYLDQTVSVIDTDRRTVVRTLHVDGRPVELAVARDGVWAALEKPG